MSEIALPTQRNIGIDVLRGLSIIFVIIHHIHLRLPLDQGWVKDFFSTRWLKVLCWSGYYSVIVFFVISGFLIVSASLQRWGDLSKVEYIKFICFRFARIFPCLFALLVTLSFFHLFGINGFIIKSTTLWHALFSAFTFHINWLESVTGYLPGNWDVLWSLSVEETFYIFFPLICIFTRDKIIFTAMMLMFIVVGPISRSIDSSDLWWNEYSYFSCMDAIAIGCLAAYFNSKVNLNRKAAALFLSVGISLSLFICIFREEVYEFGLTKVGVNVTVLGVGTALLLVALQQKNGFQLFKAKKYLNLIILFGKNSYEIYLTHMFIVLFATNVFLQSTISLNMIPLWYIGILILSLGFGVIISKYYSVPLNKFLRKGSMLKMNPTSPQARNPKISGPGIR